MKRIFELTLMAACIGGIFYSTFADAQSVNYTRKYRVIAYKAGNTSITSTSNETVVIPTMSLYIPNSFTPNGDGMNETFGAYGESVNGYTMQVFDRWGELVFESSGINNKWDGSYKGKMAPQGSYVYKITAQGPDGRIAAKKGTVNLIQ